eukprot:4768425-Amphidinium_carterae.1
MCEDSIQKQLQSSKRSSPFNKSQELKLDPQTPYCDGIERFFAPDLKRHEPPQTPYGSLTI